MFFKILSLTQTVKNCQGHTFNKCFLFSLLNFFRFAKEFYGRPTDLTCFSWFKFSSLGGTTEKTTQDYIFLEYIKYYTYYAPHKGGILHLNYP